MPETTASADPTSRPEFLRSEAEPGPLSREVIARFRDIKGFFNEDDCMHFHLVLRTQSLLGFVGDVLEIGSYFGRSAALLARCLQPGETLVACDAFERETQDSYASTPSVEDLRRAIGLVNPDFDFGQLDARSCLSTELDLAPTARFRFVHIDGGHDAETAYHDIAFAAARLLPRGVIAVDDYAHPDWPGVTEAVDRFLGTHAATHHVMADLNRHVAKGRKLYIAAGKITGRP